MGEALSLSRRRNRIRTSPDVTDASMPIAIAGMHRSGTSLVSHVLSTVGLYLGPPEEIVGANQDNLDGYWEHRGFVDINDEILARLGASWERPPELPLGLLELERLDDLRPRALALIEELSTEPVWGWKDPRTSLTLPFWLDL